MPPQFSAPQVSVFDLGTLNERRQIQFRQMPVQESQLLIQSYLITTFTFLKYVCVHVCSRLVFQ